MKYDLVYYIININIISFLFYEYWNEVNYENDFFDYKL